MIFMKGRSNTNAKFGVITFDFISQALFNVINGVEIPESVFLENERFFGHGDSNFNETGYFTNFEGLLRIFGEEAFYQELRRVEQSLWIRFNQAQALIENEDNKTNLVLW